MTHSTDKPDGVKEDDPGAKYQDMVDSPDVGANVESTKISFIASPEPEEDEDGPECLVLIYGASIGKKFDIPDEDITIGREPGNEVVVEVESVSRRHACLEKTEEGRFVADLGSTNGTYLNDQPVDRSLLKSGDLVRVGDVIFKYLAGSNFEAAYHEEIYQMTISDGLTSIANVRYLKEFLEREFARSRRYGRGLCILMVDIDFFKRVNDDLGHLTGDHALRELARILARRVRREELLARYGGEEFAIVLPETSLEGAVACADSIREMVEDHDFSFEGHDLSLTVSIGVAAFDPNMGRPADLIRSADEKLYEAKRGGRNKVCS